MATKFLEIRVGDVMWVGTQYEGSDGDKKVIKMYPSYEIGKLRRPGQKLRA